MISPSHHSTIKALAALLDRYDSLWIATDEPSLRTKIVIGILGDGTPQGTQLQIIAPDGHSSYTESFTQFAEKYEDVTCQGIAVRDDLQGQIGYSHHSLLKRSSNFTLLIEKLETIGFEF